MRIAVVTWSSRRVGGVEDYLSMLIPALHRAAPVAFWHEVDTPHDRARIEVPAGTLDICAAEVGLETSIRQLREWKPDVLYVQGVQNPEIEAKLLEIAPAVCFVHDYTATCISGTKMFARPHAVACDRRFGPACLAHYFPSGCGGNNPITMWRLFETQSNRLRNFDRYAAIVTSSEHMRKEMAHHGLHADVLAYPIATDTSNGATRRGGGWQLLFAGRMENLKGGDYLIEAAPEVARATRRPLRVVLAGDGRERAHWEALAERVQKSTADLTIEFTGWLSQEALSGLMKSCDLLVVPSLWPEPFGLVGPSAAQYGLPAAAFANGGIPDWLGDGVTGHLAPADPPTPQGLARAIVQCLEDPAHYAALRNGARAMAARFTMERHLPALMARLSPFAQ
jgi:glycosyltransferase involved in cell wall biosynthesis